MERVSGAAPDSPTWKDGVLADILYPHLVVEGDGFAPSKVVDYLIYSQARLAAPEPFLKWLLGLGTIQQPSGYLPLRLSSPLASSWSGLYHHLRLYAKVDRL